MTCQGSFGKLIKICFWLSRRYTSNDKSLKENALSSLQWYKRHSKPFKGKKASGSSKSELRG